jgi:glycosyltransferase involved in cell wall biosynthesis
MNNIATSSERIKVTYVIPTLGPHGGAEQQMRMLLANIDQERFQPSLILFEPSTRGLCPQGVDLRSLEMHLPPLKTYSPGARQSATALHRLYWLLRELQPDVVHAFLPASCFLAGIAGRTAHVPILVGSRRSLIDCYRPHGYLRTQADRLGTRLCHLMIGNSEAVSREIRTFDGVPDHKVVTIYNGVDVERFNPAVPRSYRETCGCHDGDLLIGMIANFINYKRHTEFVAAAALLNAKFSNLRFVLVGSDRGTLPELIKQIERLGLKDRITIVRGGESVEHIYAAMDLYVCSSETEGFSNAILEAMASGKPVVATNVGGNPEAVADNQTGFIVPKGQPEAIAASCARLIADSDLLARMGRQARLRAVSCFSVNRMVRVHERLYDEYLQQRRA